MSRTAFQAVIGILVAAWVVSASMFTVKETELAIKFRLREIVATDYEPGLHFMIPWVEAVEKFDARVLTRNYPAEPFLTSEGKILNVDSTSSGGSRTSATTTSRPTATRRPRPAASPRSSRTA
jgi:membrane protease subunit HflC